MPYEGEYAGYRSVRRIAEAERVKRLLRRSRVLPTSGTTPVSPIETPDVPTALPAFVVAVDGSYAEVDVQNGYPGAKVGYCTVVSVLLKVAELDSLDLDRPVDPRLFRETQEASTIDAAFPGSNVVSGTQSSAKSSFREELYEVVHEALREDDGSCLLDTYEALLSTKPQGRGLECPYSDEGCARRLEVGAGLSSCPCELRRPIYSTDALRIHEAFREIGSNGEALGEVMEVWERLVPIHLLRCLKSRGWLGRVDRLGFIVDGPLAVFGHPAWLSAAISAELKRLNARVHDAGGRDILLLGIEKSGTFVTHFEELDRPDAEGKSAFAPRTSLLPTDHYIKERIVFSGSTKRYGADTYFGRKFLYKTASGARIVADIPFLTDEQDTLEGDAPETHDRFPDVCCLLDRLASSRYRNGVTPIISAHAEAAIPLNLGGRVLQQLAAALMQQG